MNVWKAVGAAAWGAVAFGGLLPFLEESRRDAIAALCPKPGGVYVAAFPYFAGRSPGNLALYCRGEDYHRVLLRRLTHVCEALQREHPAHQFLPGTDSSPLPERLLARLAGLGEVGEHGLLILPPYGSYLFLGTILTDLPLESTLPSAAGACTHCGACRRACPTQALTAKGFDHTRCLSHLSQKKGDLSPWEADALRNSPLIWGCERCQAACPHNHKPQETEIAEFREPLLSCLHAEDLADLTNRGFRERYGDRAFAWRGPAVLRRNLALRQDEKESE